MGEAGGRSWRPGPKTYLLGVLFAAALVLLPFLFWYDTWFGRRLTDAQIGRYLNEAVNKPRRAQHALVQMGERLARGDRSVARWYPKVIELGASPAVELRQTVAWIMGQDPSHEPFRAVLRMLLEDPTPLVRRNAALSLAGFRDTAGRPELRSMLRPSTIAAPAAGVVKYRLKPGDYVNAGTLVARLGGLEVRSPLPGEVRRFAKTDGAPVAAGEPLVELSPDEAHAWEALRALFLVGTREDLEDVQRFARGVSGMDRKLRQQALLTAGEIGRRNP